MEPPVENAAVLARLDRIAALDRRPGSGVPVTPGVVLGELRLLLRDADLPVAPPLHREEVVERLRTAPHRT